MRKVLIVVDMQNDFVTGCLGTKESRAIVPSIEEKINRYLTLGEKVIFTQDTHDKDYMSTLEGANLPVPHCNILQHGWRIIPELKSFINSCTNYANLEIYIKHTFGCIDLAENLRRRCEDGYSFESIELVGVCTGICVISNALLLKAYCPEIPIIVDASCCACVSPESHKTALEAMKLCQIKIIGENDD